MFAVATVKHGACGVLDGALSATLLLHTHMGFGQVIVDYIDKRKYPKMGPMCKWILRAGTLAAAAGLYGMFTLNFVSSVWYLTAFRIQHKYVCAWFDPRWTSSACVILSVLNTNHRVCYFSTHFTYTDDVGITEMVAKLWTA